MHAAIRAAGHPPARRGKIAASLLDLMMYLPAAAGEPTAGLAGANAALSDGNAGV